MGKIQVVMAIQTLALSVFAAGLLIAALSNTHDWKPGWEMFSAIGTVGAVVIAVHLALGDKRRIINEGKSRATITAALHLSSFIMFKIEIRRWIRFTEKLLEAEAIEVLPAKIKQLEKFELEITHEHLIALTGMQSKTAERLARAMDSANVAKIVLTRISPTANENKKQAAELALNKLRSADKMMASVVQECKEALKTIRTEPDE